MNILHLARTMGQGGAEKIIYQLAVGCKSKNHKIVVASCGGVYEDALKTDGIVHYHVQDLECKQPHVIVQTLCTLIKIIKKEDIQILHSHHRMAALYGRLLKCFYPKLQLVYTAHNVFYDKVRLTSMALQHTTVVAVGESVKENLIQVFQMEEDSITTIFNAVDISALDTNVDSEENTKSIVADTADKKIDNRSYAKNLNGDAIGFLQELKDRGNTLIGIIGRLSEQKGVDVFLKAMGHLTKEYPNVKGIVIGDGEQRQFLESLARTHNLTDTVYFLGYQKDIMGIIRQLDYAAMPSRWEGFPLTPIELFAMGKTLVASDIGGINEIVKDGKNGLLIPKDDDKELTMALEVLLVNKDLRQQLAQQARYDYEEFYSYQSFLEQYISLYEDLYE